MEGIRSTTILQTRVRLAGIEPATMRYQFFKQLQSHALPTELKSGCGGINLTIYS